MYEGSRRRDAFPTVRTTLFALAGLAGGALHASAEDGLRIALIVDASNSMRSELPGGTTRMDGAKTAALSFVAGLKPEVGLSVWAYGHRSATDRRDCEDIEEIAPMTPAATGKAAATGAIQALQPRGYTPIGAAVTRAAKSLGAATGDKRMIVLVSDGKETCTGDPCAVAQALARADASLVVHVVGLGVDAATRTQLQCIADRGRGKYFDAGNTAELSAALATAAVTRAPPPEPAATGPATGRLTVKRSGGHRVFDSETGKEVGWVAAGGDNSVDLPPGIYNVRFPEGAQWRGVQVRVGATTVIAPGILQLTPPLNNHKVRDIETGEEFGFLPERAVREAVLIPGVYSVSFGTGDVLTVPVDIKPDTVTTYKAGAIRAEGVGSGFWPIVADGGRTMDELNAAKPVVVVPPGTYQVRLPTGPVSVSVDAGATVVVGKP